MTGMLPIWGKDFNRSLLFDRDGLRWKAEIKDDIAFFPVNSIVFASYLHSSLAEGAGVPAETTGFPEFTLAYLTNSEKEVDSTLKKAKGLGTRIQKPGEKTFWSAYGGYFTDPDGFLHEVALGKGIFKAS